MPAKLFAEFLGTFWLVLGGCGSAVLAAKVITPEANTPINIGIGLVGVSLAFGLTVLTMAYIFVGFLVGSVPAGGLKSLSFWQSFPGHRSRAG